MKSKFKLLILSLGLLILIPAMAGGRVSAQSLLPDAVIVKDRISLLVSNDYTLTLKEDETIKILNDSGAKNYGKVIRTYWQNYQDLQVTRASVTDEQHNVREMEPAWLKIIEPPNLKDHSLYQEFRMMSLSFPDLKPGDTLHYEITLHNLTPLYKNAFWGTSFLQEFVPISSSQFSVSLPKGAQFYYATPGNPYLEPLQESLDGMKQLSWEAKEISPVVTEPFMPPMSEIANKAMVSSFKTPEELSAWFYAYAQSRTAPDKALKLKVKSLLAKAPKDELGKIKALYQFVRDLPETGLEIDFNWLSSVPASNFLQAPNLTDNDKALLLLALLRSANLKAYPVLADEKNRSGIETTALDPQQFDAILVAIPQGDGYLWLDPAMLAGDFGMPAFTAQGMPGLVALPQGGKLITLPALSPQANREEMEIEAFLDQDDNLQAAVGLKEYGVNKAIWDNILKDTGPLQHQRVFALLAAQITPKATIEGSYTAPYTLDGGTYLSFNCFAPRFAQASGKYRVVKLPIIASRHFGSLLDDNQPPRRYPLELGNCAMEEKRLHLSAPEGYRFFSLPKEILVQNDIGELQLSYKTQGRELWMILNIVLKQSRVLPAEMEQFKALYKNLQQIEQEVLILEDTRAGGAR